MRFNRKSIAEFVGDTGNHLARTLNDPRRQLVHSFGRKSRAEPWSVHQVQFSEDSRVAARRALWFLRLVEIDSGEQLCRHAQRGALQQLETVDVPDDSRICKPGDGEDKCGYTGALEPKFATLAGIWEEAAQQLGAARTLSVAELRKVEASLEHFIKRSRPLDLGIATTYVFVPAFKQVIGQHFALLATLALTFLVAGGVEAVRSLLLNQPYFTILVVIAALLPLGILYVWQKRRHRAGMAAWWNLGGRIVHAFPASLEPERWLRWHPNGYARKIFRSLLYKVGLHVLLWAALGVLLALAIRILGVDQVWLTVYLIVMLCALVVLAGGALDFADMHSPAQLRGLVLGSAAVVGFSTVISDHPLAPLAAIVACGAVIWWRSWRVRSEGPSHAVPILIGGVAIVSLYFTTSRRSHEVWRPRAVAGPTLSTDEWPRGDASSGPVVVMAASGGGSRAAIFAARTLMMIDAQFPQISEDLQAISSVSGGSLATAAYVARRLRSASLVADSLAPTCDEDLVEAARKDFIQPTILGLGRSGGRGGAIQRVWEQCPVGLGRVTVDDLARAWRQGVARQPDVAPFPVPLFNSVSLERHAVVLSPLDQSVFAMPFDAEARNFERNAYRNQSLPTWVYYRSGIYHLKDLSDSMDAPLSAAVRASANFPFGFPLVEVEARKPLWYSTSMADTTPHASRLVRLTDGGALSNSGMWPLVPLLVQQRPRIGNDRGVLMVVVDASRMPGPPWTDRQRGLFATLLDKNPKGERLHYQMLDRLVAEYGGCFGYVYIGIEPTPKYNVYTTWALDRGSLEVVDSAFANAWSRARVELDREYQRLQKCRNGDSVQLRAPRVPLS